MKNLSKKGLIESIVGFALIAVILVLGFTGVFSSMVFIKTLIGMGFGYALIRGDFGFAGLANRTCRKGSTKLIRNLMLLFVVSAIIVGAFLATGQTLSLWINPISLGLVVGGILFGVGMAFSSCCATGVMQDVPVGFSRAMITLLFFGIGVFVGFPLMKTGFASNSLFTDGVNKGVSMTEWFKWDGTNGVVGAILVTVLFAVLIGLLAKWFEKKIAKNFPAQQKEVVETEEVTTYDRFFVKKWSGTVTVLVIALLFGLLYIVSATGWGASTVYGHWFGRLLYLLGVSPEALANFTKQAETAFTTPLLKNAGQMQNVGIILGAAVSLLLAKNFTETFKNGLKIKPLEIALFAMGGFLMGFGTRLSLGCNVGALYTPIANFSLAGWIYFFFLFGGGYLGNMIRKSFYKVVDPSQL
ncbi:MAG: YeeE/YedE family protein [Bacilli bacterium]